MIIPTSFKEAIKSIFYDKEITLYSSSSVVSSSGYTRKGTLTEVGTFTGNVNYSKLAKVQEDYGIKDKIDVTITAPTDTVISLDQVIGYSSKYYKVIELVPYDSHLYIIAQKWSSKSLTWISA